MSNYLLAKNAQKFVVRQAPRDDKDLFCNHEQSFECHLPPGLLYAFLFCMVLTDLRSVSSVVSYCFEMIQAFLGCFMGVSRLFRVVSNMLLSNFSLRPRTRS